MSPKWRLTSTATPCCTFIGPEGAGHYVKMVHNGIEYADMQLIAEAYDLFKSAYGLDAGAMPISSKSGTRATSISYLIEITAAVLRKRRSHRQAARRRHPR